MWGIDVHLSLRTVVICANVILNFFVVFILFCEATPQEVDGVFGDGPIKTSVSAIPVVVDVETVWKNETFKCMTVSLDVFEDFSRLFEMFGIVQIYLEYF